MRILIVDDEPALLEAYRYIFESSSPSKADRLNALASELFGAPNGGAPKSCSVANVTYCSQGLDAVAAVEAAIATDEPYQVAFIDVRMPPGIDGKETARRIRLLDPRVNIVIVTAYSDHGVTEISAVAGPPDKIFYISKPFAAGEIEQMATALSQRWEADARQIAALKEKVAELAESEARARHAAHHDFLTGAPNRLAFQLSLNSRILDKHSFALAILDLDRFKAANDLFGHAAGDHLLQTIYAAIREELPPGTMVARLGGDEFAIVIECNSLDQVLGDCSRLIERCSRPYFIYGNSVQVGASIGLLWSKDFPGRDANDLMRFADIALYEAKRSGRGQWCRFDAKMDASTQFRQTIEAALRDAITNDELEVHYQPIVERDALVPVGFEALLRWRSPVHGDVPPGVFIPIAEENALILEIGDWVLRRALQDSLSWPNFFVSVNFSPSQFKRSNFIEAICAITEDVGVPFNRVQIEITETAMFDDVARATQILADLQGLGFRVALDDFGTGYSNLMNVKNFALDCIKIDKSFVEGLGVEANAAAIVGTITQLARALGLSIIAEGVETEVQCQALRVIGCSHMQGYLFGRAEPAAASNARYEAAQAAGIEDIYDAAPLRVTS